MFNTIWDYQALIRDQLIDYVRGAVTHMGGVSHLKKVLEYAAQYQIKSGMHGPGDVSPIGIAAQLHLGLAIHNFGIQEYGPRPDVTREVFQYDFAWHDGYVHPGDGIGLGVDFDVDAAARHPYEQAYLPVARLRDGTLHDW